MNVPEGIPALNLDIMRLCAQMVARNGTKFLKSELSRLLPWPQSRSAIETCTLHCSQGILLCSLC